eukprot:1148655-Pelagomonas_calceolata.AAC.2
MGRKDKECGQIGVSSMAGTLGCTMEPPAETDSWPARFSGCRPTPCNPSIKTLTACQEQGGTAAWVTKNAFILLVPSFLIPAHSEAAQQHGSQKASSWCEAIQSKWLT